jgi:hypothetical protein
MIFWIAMSLQATAAPTEADIEAAMQRALAPQAEAWSTCMHDALEAGDARRPAAAEATRIVALCRPQQDEMVAAHARFLDGAPLTDAQKEESRRAWAASLRALTGQLRRAVVQQREQAND